MQKVLEIGAGRECYKGRAGEEVTHMDIAKLEHIEVVHDANKKWPFEDDSFDKVVMNHCLEHLEDVIFIMEEVHRVLIDGGVALINVPYYTNMGAFQDPTHKHFFSEASMDYFTKTDKNNHYSSARFKILNIKFEYAPTLWFVPFKSILRYLLWNIVRSVRFVMRVEK